MTEKKMRGAGLARFRNSPAYAATVAKTLADQDVAATKAAKRTDSVSRHKVKLSEVTAAKKTKAVKIDPKTVKVKVEGNEVTVTLPPPPKTNGHLIADPKKEGIPLFLQTQNRKPLTAAEQERVDAFMAKKTKEAKAAINPVDAKAREEITKGLTDKAAKEIKRNNRFAKLEVKKEGDAALAAGATWDTRHARWVLTPELASEAKQLLLDYNKLVSDLRKKGINKWKYRAEPFFDVNEAKVKIGVLQARMEGKVIAEEEDAKKKKAPKKRRGGGEDDATLLARPFVIAKEVVRQEGSARTNRWLEAIAYLKKAPKATLGDITKNTGYTVADYRLDLRRGSVKA